MCFANAVLQLLVHSPPSWNLFRELCEFKEQRGALEFPETGGGATPLVDTTIRFFEEFTFNEKEPHSAQQPPQHSTGGISRQGEEKEKDNSVVDSFEPTYLYDAMKESRLLKTLLVGSHTHAAPFCH
jgi:ubiquitin carboxyl-terminal hydrolase 10